MNFRQVQIMWHGLYISFYGPLLSYLILSTPLISDPLSGYLQT